MEDTSQTNSATQVSDNHGMDIGKEIERYAVRIDGIKETLILTMTVAKVVRDGVDKERKKFLDKYGTEFFRDEQGEIKSVNVPAQHIREVEVLARSQKHYQTGLRTLPKTHLVALVSAFDFLLGRLVRWYFLKVPAALHTGDKNIGLSELLEFGSIEVAKEYFMEKELETLLRKSHSKQFDWLEAKLGCTLRKNLGIWPAFVEVTERRNLFVHTDGYVSRQYLKVCREAGYKFDKEPTPGDHLGVSRDYFEAAVDVIFQMGVMLGQTMWRKVAPGELKGADTNLVGVTFDLLKEERFATARDLLDFAVRLPKFSEEASKKIMIINRAQSYKWLDDRESATRILSDVDWTASAAEFQLCVAVLEDRFEDAASCMRSIGTGDSMSEGAYITWPVFRTFRESSEFVEAFREIYGHDPVEKVASEAKEQDEAAEGDTTEIQDETRH